MPDYEYDHKEMQKSDVTLNLLRKYRWELRIQMCIVIMTTSL